MHIYVVVELPGKTLIFIGNTDIYVIIRQECYEILGIFTKPRNFGSRIHRKSALIVVEVIVVMS